MSRIYNNNIILMKNFFFYRYIKTGDMTDLVVLGTQL